MRIPDNLMPKVVADRLGVSMGKLAQLLNISYHTLHGWARRGSAPAPLIQWLEAELPKAKQRYMDELVVAHPIDAAKAVVGDRRLHSENKIPQELTLRKVLGRPLMKERGRREKSR